MTDANGTPDPAGDGRKRYGVTPEQAEQVAGPPEAAPAANGRAAEGRADVIRAARADVARIRPGVMGQHGSDPTFGAACHLVIDWGLSIEEARPLMREYSERCQPPWSEEEIEHKLQDATKRPGPRGERLARWQAWRQGRSRNGHTAGAGPEEPPQGFGDPVPISRLQTQDMAAAWLWRGYMARGTITLWSALWKSGKSTLLAHLYRAMGQGGDLCGLDVAQGKVLLVTEEPEGLWAERRDRLGIGDHVHVLVRPFAAKPDYAVWLTFIGYLAALCRREGYALVSLDTLPSLWPVLRENDASEVQAALMPLRQITAADAALNLVHHSRKGDGQEATAARGSGALAAFVDTVVELRRHDPANRKDRRRVLTGYGRYTETPDELVVELAEDGCGYVLHGDTGQVWRRQAAERESLRRQQQAAQDRADDEALVAALDELDPDGKGAGSERTKVASRLSRDRAQRAVSRLKAAGVIEEMTVSVRIGGGGERQAKGLRRVEE